MLRQIGFALVRAVLVVWLAASTSFVLLQVVPGDAARTQAALAGRDAETASALRALYGLDRPLWQQYLRQVLGPLRGDFGLSFLSGQPVVTLIAQRAGPTVTLALGAVSLAVVGGVVLGLGASTGSPRAARTLCRALVALSLSVPLFWSGTIALYALSRVVGGVGVAWLPAVVLGFHTAGPVARVVEARWDDIQHATFIAVARGKGLAPRWVLLHHAGRHLMLSLLPVVVVQVGYLLGGAVITESLFARPGLGRLLLEAVGWQDYPVVQGLVVLSAVVVVGLSALADGLAIALDPRLAR